MLLKECRVWSNAKKEENKKDAGTLGGGSTPIMEVMQM